jgi:hypothetical protein
VLSRAALGLYPPAWRARYGSEVYREPRYPAAAPTESPKELRSGLGWMNVSVVRVFVARATPATELDSAETLTGYHRPDLQR